MAPLKCSWGIETLRKYKIWDFYDRRDGKIGNVWHNKEGRQVYPQRMQSLT